MNRNLLSSSVRSATFRGLAGVSAGAFALCLAATGSAFGRVSNVAINMAVPSVPGAVQTGTVPGSTKLRMTLTLSPANRAAFEDMARQVSDPRSPNYHHFMTPTQIGAKFGPSTSTVNAAVSYLKSKGMTVSLTADNHMAIVFSGTATQVQNAFSIKLATYKAASRADGGRLTFFSYTSAPKLPSTFASTVVAIDGLQSAFCPVKRSTLTPSQTRTLYQSAALYPTYKGENINVGITNYDGYRLSNLPLFYSTYGLATPAGGVGSNVTKVSYNGLDGNTADAEGEGDLDIQLALAVAPLCNLYIYDAGGTSDYVNDYLGPITLEAQQNTADIISESYGYPTSESTRSIIQSAHDQHVSMTLQGITYMLASGDYGTDLLGNDYPNFDPEILLVGGTVATVDAAGNRQAEDGWDGSGAGYSTFDISFNKRPSYQVGTGVPTGTTYNFRLFPDLALHAIGSRDDSTEGYDFVFDGALSGVSGTSASSPTFAGNLALVLQSLIAQGGADPAPNGRYRLGRINDFIYDLDGDPSVFYDVTTGDAGPLPNGVEAVGKVGWDFVTGFGAPSASGLMNAFISGASNVVKDAASSAGLYTITSPTLTLGTVVGGDVTSLPSTDGVSYQIQSVKQTGLGQVAAATVSIPLQTQKTRRSAAVNLALSLPAKATGYLYLLNASTGAYDLVSTIAGTGAMTTTNVALDVSANTYISGNTVTALVRSLIPSRLGSLPFTMSVDQLTVTERVARS